MGKNIDYTAEEYARTKKESSFRNVVEMHTIFSLINNPAGLYILDAGCGDGIYARELADRGAKHIVGVDCAEDFIKMANQKNKGYEDRIKYYRAFVQDFFGNEDRDLVVGSFVLSYPRNLEETVAYCSAMASHLKEGGQFIGFNNNTFEKFEGERYEKYGFKKIMTSSKEGSEVHYLVKGMDNPIVNFHLKPQTYEKAFRDAGFSEFQWSKVQLHPSEQGNSYWDDFFKDEPPFIAMIAKK